MEAKNERSVVASGKTVEDAIANGLAMLGARRDQVDVEIISEGSRGVLGFGAENARVQLTVKAPPAPTVTPARVSVPTPVVVPMAEPPEIAPEPPPPVEIEPMPIAGVAASGDGPEPAEEPEPESDDTTAEQVGREVLSDLLRLMGVRASVESLLGYELADEGQPPPIVLNITGDDLGILIGRRGETLRALQYLVRLMVSHRLKHWSNMVVDVENYLVRRRNALESLAVRMAEQAVRTGRTQSMEPMPAYERRLVHISLRKNPKVSTHSVGEGEKRKVTIIPKKK